ncbi:NrfD/PsrC family molybdoenzyme membrane anchor subunit [Thermodesulfobacteriota bacterium]
MQLERQETFGWLISLEIFLAGAGAGAFLFGFIYHLLGRYLEIAKTGMTTGLCLVMIGAVLLFFELGKKKRFYRVTLNKSSWITRGSWFLTIYLVCGLVYLSSAYTGYLDIFPIPVKVIGVIAALVAVFVMSYTGFLFGAVKRVPLWNTSGLSMLFFLSSLYTGQAVILFITYLLETSLADGLLVMIIIELILIFLQMIALGTFLGTAAYGGTISSESVHLLIKNPLFVILVVVVGLLIPVGLLGYLVVMNHTFILSLPVSIFLLIGGFYLRHGILRAGIRLPVSAF